MNSDAKLIPDPISAGDPEGPFVICKLDGKVLANVTAASTLQGWADVLVTDEDGNGQATADRSTFATRRLYGVVEIKWLR